MKRPLESAARSHAVGHQHGAARKRNRDGRVQLDAAGMFGGQGERQKAVVAGLHRPDRIEAAASAALAAAGTSRKLRVERPVSSFIIFRSRVNFSTSGRNRNKACGELERARSAPRGRASANHFEQAARVVADQSVHAHVEQFPHLGFLVHRPDVHFESDAMGERRRFRA